MKVGDFKKLRSFDYEDSIIGLDVDDCFLMGEYMVEQVSDLDQNESRVVSYYRVVSKNGKNVSYVIEIEKLED